MTLAELAPQLANPQVRALAWLIGSPGLLEAQGEQVVTDDWCHAALAEAAPWLLALDREPQPLLDFLAQRTSRRVGRLAESLLSFWLRRRAGVELLAENLAVRGEQRTLGEFDFIFREPGQAQATHWETAVKFYLFRPEIGGLAGYAGPAGEDLLAAKAGRIFTRQLALGASPEGATALAALGVSTLRTRAWVKGWLFYPLGQAATPAAGTNPAHAHGWWLRHAPGWERELQAGRRYAILPRLDWLVWPWSAAEDETLSIAGLAAAVDLRMAAAGESLLVVEMEAEIKAGIKAEEGCWRESSRGFIVPATWGTAPV